GPPRRWAGVRLPAPRGRLDPAARHDAAAAGTGPRAARADTLTALKRSAYGRRGARTCFTNPARANAATAVTTSVARRRWMLALIASSTRSLNPVSGWHSGELARIASSMPLGRKKALVCWTKTPLTSSLLKLQKPPFV